MTPRENAEKLRMHWEKNLQMKEAKLKEQEAAQVQEAKIIAEKNLHIQEENLNEMEKIPIHETKIVPLYNAAS